MARSYRRNYSRGSEAAKAHVRAYKDLERKLGPIVRDVTSIFLSLNDENLFELLESYKKKYGYSAWQYAQNTMSYWRSGERKMSGQTAGRLLNLVPKYMSTKQRFELVKKLHTHFVIIKNYEVSIDIKNPSVGLSRLSDLTESIIDENTGALPAHVHETITWLNDYDAKASKNMLEMLDKETNQNSRHFAEKELRKIHSMLYSNEEIDARYNISFINASIDIDFYRPRKSFFRRIFG